MLVDHPFMHAFLVLSYLFSFFLLLVTYKDEKICFNAETNDFDQ